MRPTRDAADLAHIMRDEPPLRTTDRFSFADALAETGVPGADTSPEEELVTLLLNAAEIEHGLMLQYLYASYSLKEVLIGTTLRTIALEEMGHFVTVQNLLVACGAEPYLGHSDWDLPHLDHPFPFRLEPASVGSIAKYTIAEMPDRDSVPPDVEPDFDSITADADRAAGSPVEPHRVGLLYAKIYWLLRRDDHPLSNPSLEPWPGFPVAEMAAEPKLAGRHVRDGFVTDARDVNAQPGHWRGTYTSVIVAPIFDRDVALSAIASVSAQGEGFATTTQSHFQGFVEAWRQARKSADLAHLAPVNPRYTNGGTSAACSDEITSVVGRQFAQMGDGLYELVLLCTAANLMLPAGTAAAIRKKAAQASIVAMRDCLGLVARELAGIPLTDDGVTDKVCGLPFAVIPLEIEGTLKAVVDRAMQVMSTLKTIAADVSQGNAGPTQKAVAEGVAAAIDDEIAPKLNALPV